MYVRVCTPHMRREKSAKTETHPQSIDGVLTERGNLRARDGDFRLAEDTLSILRQKVMKDE
jgi:hypothetical protein